VEFPEKAGAREHGGKYGVIASLLLIVAVISIAFLVYMKSQGVDLKELNIRELITKGMPVVGKKEAGEVIAEFKYNPEEPTGFTTNNGYIVKCAQDGIWLLDKNGENQWSKLIALNKPMVKSAGSYIMAADMGGKDIYVIKDRTVRWSEKLDNVIINADVNSKGYVSVATELEGYKGAVTVYDSHGNWIFTTARAEDHILSARVLSSSPMVLITSVNISGDSVATNLELVDMYGKTQAALTRQGEIIPSAWELKDGWIAAAGSKTVLCFNSKKDIRWEHSFDRIYSTAVLSDKQVVAAVKEEDGAGLFDKAEAHIKTIDLKGEVEDLYSVKGKVINLKAHDGIIAVNTGKEVHFINSKGEFKADYKSKTDVDDVFFLSKSEAVVIAQNSIAVINIE
jgi:hypothetical protein